MSTIAFARPDVGEAEIAAVVEVLRSGWLTTGEKARQFEERFAAAVGARHAVAVSSCTAALHLALEAAGVGPDDEVIVPTMTFAASAEVVRYLGARPVLVDSLPGDHTLDPAAVDRAVTAATRAIVTVDFAGQPPRLDAVMETARRRGLVVVDDAAHAFPAGYQGRAVGTITDLTCFSFYATKTLTTGEGGMVTTDREDWARRVRLMSLHGISKDAWQRHRGHNGWYYEILAPGFKYNLPDTAAALGLAQLARSGEMLARRREIAGRYHAAFAGQDHLELLDVRPECAPAWHLYVVRLRPEVLALGRDEAIAELARRGVGTSVHFIPLHLHPYYRETYGYRPEDFPIALDLYQRSISLPIYSAMTDAEVDRVIEAVVALGRDHRR
ncbi:MAG TPA: DegT/DnrJ/EryC1/StrS family aminotransferase [Thermoanaerobaculia bacterium]|nr:DegT/DnrJ/EryC1/StrS family aminotransferase [Thermoanaerobaculia bacterium]